MHGRPTIMSAWAAMSKRRSSHAHIHHRVFLNGNKTIVFPPSPGSYAFDRMG